MSYKAKRIIFVIITVAVLVSITSAITVIGVKPFGSLKNEDIRYVYRVDWGKTEALTSEETEEFVNAVSEIRVHAKGNPREELWGSEPVGFIVVKSDGKSFTCGYDGIYFYKNGNRCICKDSEYTSKLCEMQSEQEYERTNTDSD